MRGCRRELSAMGRWMCLIAVLLTTSIASAAADPIRVMYGVSRPPFIMERASTGISFELAETAFDRMGVTTRPFFGSNRRLEAMLEKDQVQVAVEVQKTNPDLSYSDRFIAYRNFAVSRRADGIAMESFADLRGRSVCAWQNAAKHLGIADVTPKYGRYREFPEQVDQVRFWLAKRCDVIFIDDTLLKWHMKTLAPELEKQGVEVDLDLTFSPFPGDNELWFYVGFRDSGLRDAFNVALATMRADGTYDAIREEFLDRH